MLSLQDMSDRLEIQDLLARYCHAIDSRNWDGLDAIFTQDASIDYTESGGARGNMQEAKSYLEKALKQFTGMQHMISYPVLNITGDMATARSILFNPMVIEQDGAPHVFFVGAWYCDDLVRTEQGWRISHRREELSYFHNMPKDFSAVDAT